MALLSSGPYSLTLLVDGVPLEKPQLAKSQSAGILHSLRLTTPFSVTSTWELQWTDDTFIPGGFEQLEESASPRVYYNTGEEVKPESHEAGAQWRAKGDFHGARAGVATIRLSLSIPPPPSLPSSASKSTKPARKRPLPASVVPQPDTPETDSTIFFFTLVSTHPPEEFPSVFEVEEVVEVVAKTPLKKKAKGAAKGGKGRASLGASAGKPKVNKGKGRASIA